MPILARTVVLPPVPSPFLDSRSILLRTIDGGDEQLFDGPEWIIRPGITGFGLPTRDVVVQTSPGLDGGWLREVRINPREVFLPCYIASDSGHVDFLDKMERVRTFLDYLAVPDMTATDGTLELVAQSARGERRLRCVYSDGMEGTEGGTDSGSYWATFGVKLLAVDPWWRSTEDTVFEFAPATGTPFLSSDPAYPWPRSLSASVALGSGSGVGVVVPGTVPVWPTVEVVGPVSSVTLNWPGVTPDESTHVQLAAVSATETLTLTTDPRRRSVRVNGDKAWARVGTAPQFARLRPGPSALGVAVAGTAATTRVRVRFPAAFQTAW